MTQPNDCPIAAAVEHDTQEPHMTQQQPIRVPGGYPDADISPGFVGATYPNPYPKVAPAGTDVGGIPASLDYLRGVLSGLEDELDRLEIKVAPAMRLGPPQDDSVAPDHSQTHSAVAGQILNEVARMEAAIHKLRTITGLIDL